MISVERKLGGAIPYKAVFFPSRAAVRDLPEQLLPYEMARLFWSEVDLEGGARLIRHYLSRTVCIDLRRPLETIWKEMDAKGCRYEIRRAEKLAGRIRITRNGAQALQNFLALFNSFVRGKKHGVSVISREEIERFGPNTDIFLAYLDDRPLCGHVLLRDATIGRTRLLYSGNRRLEDGESARVCGSINRLLHWHELQDYHEDGFAVYDFGGFDERAAAGIASFKKSFGGEVIPEHTYVSAGTPWLGRLMQAIYENFSQRGRTWRLLIAPPSRNPQLPESGGAIGAPGQRPNGNNH